ncbi:MAG: hypothetical protein P1V97_13720, partial [Planctomycetota bacterium]|nr:hypothetical protein [Planctomycetota bacterium]
MLPAKYRLTTVLGVALLLQPTLVFAQAMLVYKRKEGQEKAITQPAKSIRSATYKVVKYKLQGGGTQDVPANELQDVYPADSYIQTGVRELNSGKITSAVRSLKRAANSNNDKIKAFGQYFYGLALQRAGKAGEAIKQYEAFLKTSSNHFYAPHATYNAGEVSRLTKSYSSAEKYYGQLSKFGDAWSKKGSYGKAVALLAQGKGKANAAKSAFSSLTGADEPIGSLAEVGVARALILLGQDADAKRKIKKLTSRGSSPAAMGGGYLALGEIEAKSSKWRPALFAFMRSALLYGDQPSFYDARNGAAKAAQGLKAGSLASRIMGAPAGYSYTGKAPNAEFVKQLMRFSAQLAGEHAKGLIASASGEEKADLEFLFADSLKFTGKQAEYQKLMSELQKKYPKHARASDIKADLLFTAKSDLARRWSAAKDETDSTKRKALVDKIQAEYKEAMAGFKELAAGAVKECQPIEDIEDKTKYDPGNVAKMRRRDTIELKYAELVYDASKTYPNGDSDRAALLNTAFELIDNFTLDRGENFSFDLLANAYKTKGLILLDQGKAKDAVEEFESLKEYIAPIQVRDKKIMAEVKKFQDSIRISGYRLFAKACSKSGDNEKAIAAFTKLEETFPNYQNTREGLLAMFELTKCLAGAGRTTEALEKIYPIVENPKSIAVKGISAEALKIEACIALAGISDAAGGEIFPPEIQFQVGFGYKIRGDDEAAIVGYKGVLTSAVTQEERAKWVPKACQEMGILLYYQKRYLEAVLAYRVLFTEFPRHPKASDAIKFARTAMNKALEVYSESEAKPGPLIALKKKLDRALVNIGGGLAGATVILKEASKLQIARKYERAALKYLEVPKTSEVTDEKTKKKSVIPVPFYPNAVANAGYCYFKAAEQAKDDKRKELMAQAEKNLQTALSSAKKLDDDKSLALASYYLGELSNFKKQYDKAVEYLQPFDDKFKNMKNFKVRSKGQQITAFLALNKSSEAEARYKAVSTDKSLTVTIMALDLADWFARAASKEISKASPDMTMVQSYRSKAADYASDWISRSKKLRRTSLLWAASLIMDGQRYAK